MIQEIYAYISTLSNLSLSKTCEFMIDHGILWNKIEMIDTYWWFIINPMDLEPMILEIVKHPNIENIFVCYGYF